VIEVVDDQAHVDRLIPILDDMITGGALVTMERVRVLRYAAARKQFKMNSFGTAMSCGIRHAVRFAVAMGCCAGAVANPWAAQTSSIDVRQSAITVRVFKAGLFRAFADDHVIRAPIAEGTVTAGPTPAVRVVIESAGMRVLDPSLSAKDREQVQARMVGPEVLDTARFPRITFTSTAIEPVRPGRWLVRGQLALHGTTRPVTVQATLENGHYKGTTRLKQTEFGIAPISIMGGTVQVKDELTIEFDIVLSDR
jgi:YceI-like protein